MNNKERITFVLSTELLSRVDALAKKRNSSRSATLEAIVASGIDCQEKIDSYGGESMRGVLYETIYNRPETIDAFIDVVCNRIADGEDGSYFVNAKDHTTVITKDTQGNGVKYRAAIVNNEDIQPPDAVINEHYDLIRKQIENGECEDPFEREERVAKEYEEYLKNCERNQDC